MAGSTIKFSYEGIGNYILRADFMVAEMGRRAQRWMDQCIATAPVYDGDEVDTHRGRYKESFSMYTTSEGGSKGNRAAGIVENSAPEWIYVEYGAKHRTEDGIREQPGHHTIWNARFAAGGD